MLRRRKEIIAEVLEKSKSFDAFGKLEEDYTETSSARGTLSLIIFGIIFVLTILEINYFMQKIPRYSYDVDFDYNAKLRLNVDITVAMPCDTIGADVLDSSSRDILTDKSINMEDTWFEMSPYQRQYHQQMASEFEILRENHHALHASLWLWTNRYTYNLPEREEFPNRPHDACRIHGNYDLNKISGNFHIITGKSVSFFGNHAHMVNLFNNIPNNFSHRIDKLSFGEDSYLIHNSLNSELKVTGSASSSFQYFITVVSTELSSFREKNTFQYSVTEKTRDIDHDHDSHGMPGIFFKYDISPVKVKVELENRSIVDLIISLIGIIGGVFSTSYMLNSFFQNFKDSLK